MGDGDKTGGSQGAIVERSINTKYIIRLPFILA